MQVKKLDFTDYLDSWGLITKEDIYGFKDGGDTIHNESTRLFCEKYFGIDSGYRDYCSTMDLFEYDCGAFRRHPDSSRWYARPGKDRLSRDAMIPALCAMIMWNDVARARRFWYDHKERNFLMMPNNGYPNGVYENKEEHKRLNPKKKWAKKRRFGDPTGPEFMSLLIRATRKSEHYKYLPALDFHTYLSALHRKYISKDRDVRNHILATIAINYFKPTKMSRRAFKANNWEKLLKSCNYWFGQRSKEPPLHRYLVPMILDFQKKLS